MEHLMKVVDATVRRAVRSYGGPLDLIDVKQQAYLACLESMDKGRDDHIELAWAIRMAIRSGIQVLAAESNGLDEYLEYMADESGESLWLTVDEEISPGWAAMFDREDELTARLREVYDENEALQAVSANATHGGYCNTEREAREQDDVASESLTDDDRRPAPFEDNEWQVDREKAEMYVSTYNLGNVHDLYYMRLDEVARKAKEVGKAAWMAGLNAPELAVFANALARHSTEGFGSRTGLVYSVIRNAIGGLFPDEYFEDDTIMFCLFPDGNGDTESLFPKGTDEDVEAFIQSCGERTTPDDVTYETVWEDGERVQQYTGWQLWDTERARKAHLRACLFGLESWKASAYEGRKAFWADRKNANAEMKENNTALREAGLKRHGPWNYTVIPDDSIPVDGLNKNGVTYKVYDYHTRENVTVKKAFSSGMKFAVKRDKKQSFVDGLGQVKCFGDFTVVTA